MPRTLEREQAALLDLETPKLDPLWRSGEVSCQNLNPTGAELQVVPGLCGPPSDSEHVWNHPPRSFLVASILRNRGR